MSDTVSKDQRLVMLAALAFLNWRDTGEYPETMGSEIDGTDLASAIDRLSAQIDGTNS